MTLHERKPDEKRKISIFEKCQMQMRNKGFCFFSFLVFLKLRNKSSFSRNAQVDKKQSPREKETISPVFSFEF